jgi:membrane associated rhomboid family serine protease
MVFLSFGLMIERYFSQKEYFTFFVGAGIIAGVMQAFVFSILNTASVPILGASGAIAAIIGVFAIKKPNEKLYFLFIIPMPVWMGISLFIGLSLGLIMFFGLGAFGIAHTAHLTGLFIGLGYGLYKFGLPTPRIGDMITMP